MNRRVAGVPLFPALLAALSLALPAAARDLAPINAARDVAMRDASAAQRTARLSEPDVAASVTVDARYGVPVFLRAGENGSPAKLAKSLASKAALDPEAAARAWLTDYADLYAIAPAEIAALPVHNVQRFDNGAALVRFRGEIDGVEVFREEVNVLLDRQRELVAIGGFAMGAPTTAKKAEASVMRPESAAAMALADFGFGPAVAMRLASSPLDGRYVGLKASAGTVAGDGSTLARDVRAKRVLFRVGSDLVPAYYLEVAVREGGARRHTDHYAYVVAADDGRVLFRRSQVAHVAYSYRVFAEPTAPFLPYPGPAGRGGFPHPTGVPDGYQPPFVAPNLVTLENFPFSRNDPWLPAGATRTTGNNADAFADLVAPELFGPVAPDECNLALPANGDMRACAVGTAFDYVYDLNVAPNVNRTQVMAGITHLFYLVNYFHDWYYDAGFDEASGNAQTSNFGRGGLGNDALIAVAHDYTELNNAYMVTPSDGQKPELHNFVWFSGTTLLKVLGPAAVAGVKESGSAEFGAQSFDITNTLVQAQDAANPAGPTTTDGCTAFTNPAAVAGKIALIDRGVCPFVEKVKNAQNAGAVAALIVNNVAPGIINMAGDDPTITIPSMSVSLADGNAIKAQLATGVTVRMGQKTGVDRDGSIDAMVIAHEWGHMISNRLVGNANGLNENQAVGMGEGFADFHEMLILVKEEDRNIASNPNFNGTYSSNAYPIGGPDFAPDAYNNAYYYGDRRYPYTRDMSKNPLTFKHIADNETLPPTPLPSTLFSSSDNSEVHNTGEVMGAMLWECYSNLLNDTGRLTFAQAQDRMKRYIVAAYKMMPIDPTFVTARDAILAVMNAQDVRDRDLCLHGFAKRGAGIGAVAPNPFSLTNNGVVESYRTVLPQGGVIADAIEYYHAGFDHYFATAIADEITKLDNGTFAGWARTGERFHVYTSALAGSADVCRFFSTAFNPKSSHFYTSDPNECSVVKVNHDWQLESGRVFGVLAPGPQGDCPTGSDPVYRMYNNGQGAAPNHRYTTSLATRTTMLARGWIPEGYGSLGVIFCAPT